MRPRHPPTNAQLFGIFNAGQFSLFLNALRSNALAKILAEPNLMALDGQPARFLAGGLFPYPVPQSSSIPGGTAVVTVQFANFGAILSFLPQILANDVIRLDVEPIFSQLNFGAGTTINGGRVPAIDQRSARTVVELREGQTLAIAGLLQTTTNATTHPHPGPGRPADRRPLVQHQPDRDGRDRARRAGDARAGRADGGERGAPVARRPGDPAQRLRVLLPRPDRRQARARLPRHGRASTTR